MKRMDQKQIDALVAAAASVRTNAHAPYSDYLVGAAVLWLAKYDLVQIDPRGETC